MHVSLFLASFCYRKQRERKDLLKLFSILLCILIFTARKRSLGQGNIFTPVCHSVHRGGHAWLLWGAGVRGCSGGHVWLLRGVCVVAPGGACVVLFGGVCMVLFGGACMVLFGGHAWFYSGGRVWFYSGGACMVFSVFLDTMRYGQ